MSGSQKSRLREQVHERVCEWGRETRERKGANVGLLSRSCDQIPHNPEEGFCFTVLEGAVVLRVRWGRAALLTQGQKQCACSQRLFLSFLSSQPSACGLGPIQTDSFPPAFKLSGNAPWHTQKLALISSVILNPVNLALKIKHPSLKHGTCRHLPSAFIPKERKLERQQEGVTWF